MAGEFKHRIGPELGVVTHVSKGLPVFWWYLLPNRARMIDTLVDNHTCDTRLPVYCHESRAFPVPKTPLEIDGFLVLSGKGRPSQ